MLKLGNDFYFILWLFYFIIFLNIFFFSSLFSSDVIVSKPIALKNDETPIIENGVFSINVTRTSNYLIWEVANKKTSKTVHVTEEIMEYPSYTGSGQKSV